MMIHATPRNNFALPTQQTTPTTSQHNAEQRNGSIRLSEEAVDKFTKRIDPDALQNYERHIEALEIDALRKRLDIPEEKRTIAGFPTLTLKPALLEVVDRLEYNAKRMLGNPTSKKPFDEKGTYNYGRVIGDFEEEGSPKRHVEIGIAPDMHRGQGYLLEATVVDHPEIEHEHLVALSKQLGLPKPKKLSTLDMTNAPLSNELENSISKVLETNFGLENGSGKDFSISPRSLPKPVQG
jgi:hypothetical protein